MRYGKREIRGLFLIVLTSVLFLSGCFKRLGFEDLPDEEAVVAYVNAECPESFSLVSSVEAPEEAEIVYTFVTERGLTFPVTSYISRGIFGDDTAELKSEYASVVRNQYAEETEKLLEETLTNTEIVWRKTAHRIFVTLSSYEELEALSRLMDRLHEIWIVELSQVEQSFPLASIHVTWESADGKRSVPVADAEIDGMPEEEESLQELQKTYLSLYESGEILSSQGIPADFIDAQRILQRLYPVTLNGIQYSQEGYDSPGTVYYDEERSTYLIRFGSVLNSVQPDPWRILEIAAEIPYEVEKEEYVLGGSASNRYKSAVVEWTVEDRTWKLTLAVDKNLWGGKTKRASLEENGEVRDDIELVDVFPEKQDASGLVYAVTLEDFCELFSMAYEIDYETGSIAFSSLTEE